MLTSDITSSVVGNRRAKLAAFYAAVEKVRTTIDTIKAWHSRLQSQVIGIDSEILERLMRVEGGFYSTIDDTLKPVSLELSVNNIQQSDATLYAHSKGWLKLRDYNSQPAENREFVSALILLDRKLREYDEQAASKLAAKSQPAQPAQNTQNTAPDGLYSQPADYESIINSITQKLNLI